MSNLGTRDSGFFGGSTSGGSGSGTVTNVSELTLGTTGTDLTSTVANSTTTPVITLNVPNASATARGVITTGAQTIVGLKQFQNTGTQGDGQLSAELLTTGTGAGWTGTSFTSGYAHTNGGGITALTGNLTGGTINGAFYQVVYNVFGATNSSMIISIGGVQIANFQNGSGIVGIRAISTAALTVTPALTTYDGIVILSIKLVTTGTATQSFANSAGTVTNELRAATSSTNTLMGVGAGSRITTGTENVIIGNAGASLINGSNNTFLGTSAANNLLASSNVTAIGNNALSNLSAGTNLGNNVGIGSNAGRLTSASAANLSCNNSVFIGHNSSPNGSGQTNQIAIGNGAVGLGSNTSVLGNNLTAATAIFGNLLSGATTDTGARLQLTNSVTQGGAQVSAIELLTTGTGGTWTGTSFTTGYTHTTGDNAALTGALAGGTIIGNYYQVTYSITNTTVSTVIISLGGVTVQSASGNVASTTIGIKATSATGLTSTPASAGTFNGTVTVSVKQITAGTATQSFANASGVVTNEVRASMSNTNTFVGLNAGQVNVGTTGISNTFYGSGAGKNNTTGANNTFIGEGAGENNTTSSGLTFIGQSAGRGNTTGTGSTFVGQGAGQANTTGTNNSFIGQNAGFNNTSGNANVAIGTNNLSANTTGANNIAIGGQQTLSAAGTSSNNVAIGFQGFSNLTTGGDNVLLGDRAGRLIENGSNLTNAGTSIFIGASTRAKGDIQTNQIVIGNAAVGLGSNTSILGNNLTTIAGIWGRTLIGQGTLPTDNTVDALQVNGNINLTVAGNKIKITTGSNASAGTVTLSGATTTVSTTAVTANSIILLTTQSVGGTAGFLVISARTAGTSFTITSSTGVADTSVVGWLIIN